jgi:hypothetical protein
MEGRICEREDLLGQEANAGTALVHIIGGLIAIGYAQNYYFHLRECLAGDMQGTIGKTDLIQVTTRTTPTRGLKRGEWYRWDDSSKGEGLRAVDLYIKVLDSFGTASPGVLNCSMCLSTV